MLAFLGRRILGAIVALFVASIVIFAALNVLPGNAASVILGRNATPAAERVLTQRMQLDRPATTRYFDWLGGFVHGDLGTPPSASRRASTSRCGARSRAAARTRSSSRRSRRSS